MGMFGGMGSAKRQFDANYLKAGRYIMRVDETRQFTSDTKGDAFKAVLTNLHNIDDNGGRAHRVGEQVTWMAMKQPYPNSFLSRVKQFVCTALECSDDDVDEGAMDRLCSDEQPLAGYLVEVEAREVPKKTQVAGATTPAMTTKTTFKRRVPMADAAKLMTAEQIAKTYPKGIPAE